MMTAFARTVILYFLIMIGLRLMGKRQIGELEPSELVLTMMISDLATVPMQDFGIPLLAGVIPILTLLSLSMLMSQWSLRSLRFRALVCGTPTVLIRNGQLQQEAMRKNRYTLDELLEELRGQGISDIEIRHSGKFRPAVGPSLDPAAAAHRRPDGAGGGGRCDPARHPHQRRAGSAPASHGLRKGRGMAEKNPEKGTAFLTEGGLSPDAG